MKKNSLFIFLCLISIVAITGAAAFFIVNNKAQAADSALTFANKVYTLKWSNKTDGGYVNEYLPNGETLDNYHTMVTVREVLQMKNQLQAAQNMYGAFKQKTEKGGAFLATIDQINKDATLVRFCIVAKAPKRNLECSAFNLQQRADDGAVMIYQYIQRYFEDELKLTPDNAQNVLNRVESDFNKIKPYITTVKMPSIVKQVIDAPASYSYGTKK